MQIKIFLRHAYIKHNNSLLSYSDCRTMGFRVPLFVVAVFSFLFVAFSDGAAPKGRKCVFFTLEEKGPINSLNSTYYFISFMISN